MSFAKRVMCEEPVLRMNEKDFKHHTHNDSSCEDC